jgi:hypothetical protein
MSDLFHELHQSTSHGAKRLRTSQAKRGATHFDRVAKARLKYIRAVLAGVEAGDSWFTPLLEDIKRQWPDLVDNEIMSK